MTVQSDITGFRQDEVGDWEAELGCHHRQPVRHRAPSMPHWVETVAGRTEHIGTFLECSLCDRAELPDGLMVVRTVGPFDESTLPAGLRRDHRVASGTWGMLRVLEGRALFTMQTETPTQRDLYSGDRQPIPPGVVHSVVLTAGSVEVDFLVPQPPGAGD